MVTKVCGRGTTELAPGSLIRHRKHFDPEDDRMFSETLVTAYKTSRRYKLEAAISKPQSLKECDDNLQIPWFSTTHDFFPCMSFKSLVTFFFLNPSLFCNL
jgi:hypothetical protein